MREKKPKPLFIPTPRGDKSPFDDFWKIKRSELEALKTEIVEELTFGEALAEYIRLNLNISDVQNFPDNRIKVELIAPRLNESNVRIVTAKNRHEHFNDWRLGL